MPSLVPSYAALAAAILLGVSGQILLKLGAERGVTMIAQFFQPFTIVGLAAYAAAAVFYMVAIKRIPLSLAFPTVSLSYVVVAVAAHLLWNEPLGARQFAGIALIAGGIFVLHRA